MWTRIFGGIFGLLAVAGFFRFPSPDTMILALGGMIVLGIYFEEFFGSFRKSVGGTGPRCAACGYDVRATPMRCPECGTAIVPRSHGFSEGAEYHSVSEYF